MLIGMVLGTVLLIIVLITMFKMDWEKIFEKYVAKEEDSNGKLEDDN